jgi:hypothetical protein
MVIVGNMAKSIGFCVASILLCIGFVSGSSHSQDGAAEQRLCEAGLSGLLSTIGDHLKVSPHSIRYKGTYLVDRIRSIDMPPCKEEEYVKRRLFSSGFFVNWQTSSSQDAVPAHLYIFANAAIIGAIEYIPGAGTFPADGRSAKIKFTESDFRNVLE